MDRLTKIELIFQKHLENKCTDKDYLILNNFIQNPENEAVLMKMIEKFGEKVQNDDSIDDTPDAMARKIFAGIKRAIEQPDHAQYYRRQKSRSYWFVTLKVAAILLVAVTASWWIYQTNLTDSGNDMVWLEKETVQGQKMTFTLTDHSTITLNSESKLSFPEQFGDTREVILEGEAFFMVSRDESKPFLVRTGDLVTRVLGTTFNVQAYPEENIRVTVATGKVSVTNSPAPTHSPLEGGQRGVSNINPKSPIILSPNQQAVYNLSTNEINKQQVETGHAVAWREGVLKFTDTRFSEVVTTLQRWYGTGITYENEAIGNCVVTFEFKNESLENVLKALKFMINIEYEFSEEKVVVLRGAGCE